MGGLFDLAKTMVSVLHKELEYKVKCSSTRNQYFQLCWLKTNTSKVFQLDLECTDTFHRVLMNS